jgi:hypothetical protein
MVASKHMRSFDTAPLAIQQQKSLRLGCRRPPVRVSAVLHDPPVVDGFALGLGPDE